MKVRRAASVVVFSSALFVGALAAPAQAQPTQDGLVNVAIGDVSILNNARIGVAAQVAANVCGVKVGPVAVLATRVDATGTAATVCTTPTGPVVISQN